MLLFAYPVFVCFVFFVFFWIIIYLWFFLVMLFAYLPHSFLLLRLLCVHMCAASPCMWRPFKLIKLHHRRRTWRQAKMGACTWTFACFSVVRLGSLDESVVYVQVNCKWNHHLHTSRKCPQRLSQKRDTWLVARVGAYMCVCVHATCVCVSACACMHVCVHACVGACVRACFECVWNSVRIACVYTYSSTVCPQL